MEDSGQRAGLRSGEKDRQPCGSQPPPAPPSPNPHRAAPHLWPPCPPKPPRDPSGSIPLPPPTFSRQISPGSALRATRPRWPRPFPAIGCASAAAANHRSRRKGRNRAANQRAQPRHGGRCRARRAGHAGSCGLPLGAQPPQCPQRSYGSRPPTQLSPHSQCHQLLLYCLSAAAQSYLSTLPVLPTLPPSIPHRASRMLPLPTPTNPPSP